MTIYDTPGRGRRQCPECEKYVPSIKKECANCDHIFKPKIKIVQTWDEPGPRRKQCTKCTKFVGISIKECACKNKEFREAEYTPKTYEKGGAGKKQCRECKKYVRNVEKKCACGSDDWITAAEKAQKKKQNEITKLEFEASLFVERYGGVKSGVTMIPAGSCPVKLTSTEKENVFRWCDKVVEKHMESNGGKLIAPCGLSFFSREFYPFGTDEYKIIKEHIWSWGYGDDYIPSCFNGRFFRRKRKTQIKTNRTNSS
jgi:hypothetical protein